LSMSDSSEHSGDPSLHFVQGRLTGEQAPSLHSVQGKL
jgi:hypothetical protein